MKRKFLILLFSLILVGSLFISVLAHGGRTDSNGGHYDRDTGDYHYHHGYEAHDHYDMDGDGDVDCPYSFEDNTRPSIDKPNTGSNSNKPNTGTNSDNENTETNSKTKRIDVGDIFVLLGYGFIIWYGTLAVCMTILRIIRLIWETITKSRISYEAEAIMEKISMVLAVICVVLHLVNLVIKLLR